MTNNLESYIEDARNFQKYGQYDFAIDVLLKAKDMDIKQEYGVEIQKLLSLNYRKLEDYERALIHINSAIHMLSIEMTDDLKKEYAICLMHKGMIYEEQKRTEKVLKCYRPALKIFIELSNEDSANKGLVINALLTIGMFYYGQKKYLKVREYLERALPYFDSDKQNDRRYITIINTLEEIKQK